MFAKHLDFLLHLLLTGKYKCAILYLPKGSKRKLNLKGVRNMKKYREIIAMGFSSEMELNAFLSTIENDESISDLAYYNLRRIAIERFYEN